MLLQERALTYQMLWACINIHFSSEEKMQPKPVHSIVPQFILVILDERRSESAMDLHENTKTRNK